MERIYDLKGGEWVDISDWRKGNPLLWKNTVTGEVIDDDEFFRRVNCEGTPFTDDQTIYFVEDGEDDC